MMIGVYRSKSDRKFERVRESSRIYLALPALLLSIWFSCRSSTDSQLQSSHLLGYKTHNTSERRSVSIPVSFLPCRLSTYQIQASSEISLILSSLQETWHSLAFFRSCLLLHPLTTLRPGTYFPIRPFIPLSHLVTLHTLISFQIQASSPPHPWTAVCTRTQFKIQASRLSGPLVSLSARPLSRIRASSLTHSLATLCARSLFLIQASHLPHSLIT